MQNAAMIFFYVIAGFCTFFVWGGTVNGSVWWGNARGGRERRPGGGQMGYRMASVKRSEPKIHLPQLINEEAIADEFSDWEQVSFRTAERFAPWISPPSPTPHRIPRPHCIPPPIPLAPPPFS